MKEMFKGSARECKYMREGIFEIKPCRGGGIYWNGNKLM
jgi:hypothetical protein